MTKSISFCSAAIIAFAAQLAFTAAVPAPSPTATVLGTYQGSSPDLKGASIAATDVAPPPGRRDLERRQASTVVGTYQGSSPDLKGANIAATDVAPPPGRRDTQRRNGAPSSISSSDGKYTLQSICDQDTSIPSYFLFGSDFQNHATDICDAALSWADSKGSQAALMPQGTPAYDGSVVLKARHKIAATIWQKGSTRMVVGTTNLGMDSTDAAKAEAHSLCVDAVNYIGNICVDGISGTNGLKPKYQWEALRDGTATWADNNGKKMIEFSFTEQPN